MDEPAALENDPAAHTVHDELDVAPVDVEKDPGEQREQLAPPETEYEPGWHCEQDGVEPLAHVHAPSLTLLSSLEIPKEPDTVQVNE